MGDLLQPTHLIIIGVLLLILFGAKRLPELGRGLGEGLKGFKDGIKGPQDPPPPPPAAPVQQSTSHPASSAPIEPK
jgi:sec-independent protein translocase protein TatA